MFLPECFDYVGESREQSVSMAAPLDSPRIQGLCEFAKELGVWLSLGGYHEKVCIFFICQQSNMHGKVQSITWKYLKGLCHCITSTSHQEIVIISLRNITFLFIFEYEDTQGSEISVLYFLLWTQGPLLINFLYLNIWLIALYFCYFLSFPIPTPYQSPNNTGHQTCTHSLLVWLQIM